MVPPEPSYPTTASPEYIKTHLNHKKNDLKSNVMKIIEGILKKNKSFKAIQEDTNKQVEAFKDETNKHKELQKKIQLNQ